MEPGGRPRPSPTPKPTVHPCLSSASRTLVPSPRPPALVGPSFTAAASVPGAVGFFSSLNGKTVVPFPCSYPDSQNLNVSSPRCIRTRKSSLCQKPALGGCGGRTRQICYFGLTGAVHLISQLGIFALFHPDPPVCGLLKRVPPQPSCAVAGRTPPRPGPRSGPGGGGGGGGTPGPFLFVAPPPRPTRLFTAQKRRALK